MILMLNDGINYGVYILIEKNLIFEIG